MIFINHLSNTYTLPEQKEIESPMINKSFYESSYNRWHGKNRMAWKEGQAIVYSTLGLQ